MVKCDGCNCMVLDRVEVKPGLKLCAYCEREHTVMNNTKKHVQRELNNLTWLIKKDHKTIRNWAKKHGFSYQVVCAVLHKRGPYGETNIHDMSKQHFNVVIALCDDGYKDILINEEYVTHV